MNTNGQTRVLRTSVMVAVAGLLLANPARAQQPVGPAAPPPAALPPAATAPAPAAPAATAPAPTAPAAAAPVASPPAPTATAAGAPPASAPVASAPPASAAPVPAAPPMFVPAGAPAAAAPGSRWDRPAPPDWLYLEPHDYQGGAEIPPDYVLVEKPRRWPFVLGGAVFGGSYGIAVLSGFAGVLLNREQPEKWGPMFIPVIGPFITIQTLDAGGTNGSAGQVGIFVLAGAVQTLGAATLVMAMFLPPKKVLVPQTPYGEVQTSKRRPGPTLELEMPRFDVARIPGPRGDQLGGSVLLQGAFDL